MNTLRVVLMTVVFAAASACSRSPTIPDPDTRGMERAVQEQIAAARVAVLEAPLARQWGALGDTLLAHGLDQDAASCYVVAADLAEDPFVWLYLAALARREDPDVETTSQLFAQASALRPRDARVHLRHALFLQSIQRSESATREFELATTLDPELARAFRGLGETSLVLDREGAAIAALEQALVLEPADRAAGSALAQAYLRTGRVSDAALVASRAQRGRELTGFDDPLWDDHVVRNGVSVSRRFERAQLALREDHLDDARAQVETILAARDDDPDAHYLLGLVEARSGAVGAAQRQFGRALEADPTHVPALLAAAELNESAGLNEDARKLIERAYAQAPGDPTTLVALAANRRRAGDLPGVIDVFQRLVALDPDLVALRLELCTLHAGQRDWEAAEREARAAVRLAPDLAAAHERLGWIHEETGQRQRAIEAYRRAMDLDPSSAALTRLRALGISAD